MEDGLTLEELESIRRLDTCTVSNAIEQFELRLRNEGFADGSINCLFPQMPAVIGYAVTGRVRTSTPPPAGHRYHDRTDWWNHILSVPGPRIVVLQDIDRRPGLGAFVGEIHASILAALNCTAMVTNGAVRDLEKVPSTGLQFFAGSVSVSHAYAHLVDFGGPVTVGGLEVRPGDLLHADRHGLLRIPKTIASQIPSVVEELQQKERKLMELCKSREFSLERLREAVQSLD